GCPRWHSSSPTRRSSDLDNVSGHAFGFCQAEPDLIPGRALASQVFKMAGRCGTVSICNFDSGQRPGDRVVAGVSGECRLQQGPCVVIAFLIGKNFCQGDLKGDSAGVLVEKISKYLFRRAVLAVLLIGYRQAITNCVVALGVFTFEVRF